MNTSLLDLAALPKQLISDLQLISGSALGIKMRMCFMQTPLKMSLVELFGKMIKREPR